MVKLLNSMAGKIIVITLLISTVLSESGIQSVFSASENKQVVAIHFEYDHNEEKNLIIPAVLVYTLSYSTGERKYEKYVFDELAYSPPAGFVTDWREFISTTDQAGKKEEFNLMAWSYTVINKGQIFSYGLYRGDKSTYSTGYHADTINRSQKLYSFDYSKKEMKLLRTAESTEKSDLTSAGTTIELLSKNDIYTVDNTATKQKQFYSLSDNKYILSVSQQDFLGPRDILSCVRGYGEGCYTGNDSISVNDNLVIRKNGKFYELDKQKKLKEIKQLKVTREQWRVQFGNYIMEPRSNNNDERIYMINQQTKKATVITPAKAFVQRIYLSPNRRYLVFDLEYERGERRSLLVYDTISQKKLHEIAMPYKEWVTDLTWHSNTSLEYTPFTSSRPDYVKDVHVEILKGIVTKEDSDPYDNPDEYVITPNADQSYFTYARPWEIVYEGKPVVFHDQPAFLGLNNLLYCSVKDLAITLNATLTVEPGKIELSYKNKKAYVDLKAKDIIIQDGTAYAPIKPIAVKLGLQYSKTEREILLK
ncbi:hypothetical protein [Paenibacillus tepidiphilus]|uniref:hypothetical protein n=1 Tax=Paenibacillus tepidiphilus TaxID=2608683 RepID=UPI00123A5AB6|nr:hypothetical protein [Paenibacillus tepidiphilus]